MFLQDRQRLFGQTAGRIGLGRLLPIFLDVLLWSFTIDLAKDLSKEAPDRIFSLAYVAFAPMPEPVGGVTPSSLATCSALVLWSP